MNDQPIKYCAICGKPLSAAEVLSLGCICFCCDELDSPESRQIHINFTNKEKQK